MLLFINDNAVATADCLESMFGGVGLSSISYLLSADEKGLNQLMLLMSWNINYVT